MIYAINGLRNSKKFTIARLFTIDRFTIARLDCTCFYGTVTGGGLAIIKNLSLEGEPFQAFLMERVPIVSDL